MSIGIRLEEDTRLIHTHQMETIEPGAADRAFCEALTDEQDELAREILSRVTDKWSLWVLQVLAASEAPVRFSRLHERVEGISQKILTQCLRRLAHDGLVTRTLYPQVPPRVEYAPTPLGRDLLVQLLPFWRWVVGHVDDFDAARGQGGG